jgi:hypothetical protein
MCSQPVAVSGSSFGFGATARVRVGVRGRIVVFVVVVPHPHLRLAPRVRRVPVARLSLDVPLVPAAAHDVARISSPRHARPSISSHRSASSVVRLRPRDRVVVVSFRFVSSGRCDSRNRVARRESRARRSRVVASRSRSRSRSRSSSRSRSRRRLDAPPRRRIARVAVASNRARASDAPDAAGVASGGRAVDRRDCAIADRRATSRFWALQYGIFVHVRSHAQTVGR